MFGLAESEDGLNWTKYEGNPVMKPTKGTWDEGTFECGSLLKIDDKYWLYYSSFGADGKIRIGLAFSEDLKSWTKYDENPIMDARPLDSWESNGVAFPAVAKGTHDYRMIYCGYGSNSMQFGLATSTDGKICTGFKNKTIYLICMRQGDIHVQIDPAGRSMEHSIRR